MLLAVNTGGGDDMVEIVPPLFVLHVPPGVASESVIVDIPHSVSLPDVINGVEGIGFTVPSIDLRQPVGNV